MKRIFASLLALALVFVLFGCDFDYAGKLTGTWVCRSRESDEQIAEIVESIDLYEEEIALIDTPLYTAVTATFTEDGTYALAEDETLSKQYIREFFDGMFTDLYEGRANLANTYADYGVDLSQLSEEEFYLFYAELYSSETYEALLDNLSENLYTDEAFEPYDEGTFKATSKIISFDAIDDELDGAAEYELEDDRLSIKFTNGTMVFYKQN